MTISNAEYEYLQSCREYAEADRGVILLSGGVSAADPAFVASLRGDDQARHESSK